MLTLGQQPIRFWVVDGELMRFQPQRALMWVWRQKNSTGIIDRYSVAGKVPSHNLPIIQEFSLVLLILMSATCILEERCLGLDENLLHVKLSWPLDECSKGFLLQPDCKKNIFCWNDLTLNGRTHSLKASLLLALKAVTRICVII